MKRVNFIFVIYLIHNTNVLMISENNNVLIKWLEETGNLHLWMISTPDLLEICDIPETGRTSLDLDRDRLGTGGTGGSRFSVDDISPALITEWCTSVPPCHCTAAGQETTLACGLMRSKARTESFLIPGLSHVFYMSLMQSKGIWLQFHAGDAMSTKTLDLCIWSKRFLLNIRFCIYLGKHFQLASRCRGNLKLKIFDSSNGENRWGILEDNWNKFWKFVLSTQGAGDPPSPISEVDLFH